MLDKKEYSNLTLEELLLEEKKVKQNELLSAFLIGILAAVMVYGIVKDGFGFIYIAIPVIMISGLYKKSKSQKQQLKQIQTEIKVKNS